MNIKKRAISTNALIVCFELIAIAISHVNGGFYSLVYYTEQSNILALISSSIILIYLLNNKTIPRYLSLFRLVTTVSLLVTFLVVIFILAPMFNFNYGWLLFSGASLYMHLLCPLLSVISFIYFENHSFNNKYDSLIGIIFTIIYAIIAIVLNILRIIEGPYPFLLVYENSVIVSIIWCVLILGGSYLISMGLLKLKKKYGVRK